LSELEVIRVEALRLKISTEAKMDKKEQVQKCTKDVE